MTSSRTWTAGAAVVAVLLVVAGWFLLISPQRSAAADLRDQTSAQQATNSQIQLKTKQLQAQFASLPARQAQLAEIKQQMPDNPALPSLIRDLSSNAEDAAVTLVSVSPGTPEVLTGVNGAAAPSAPGQPAQVADGGVLAIPTTVVVSGSYAQLTLYMQKLQTSMRRAYLVENIQLAEDDDDAVAVPASTKGSVLRMTVTGKLFMLTAAAPNAAAPVTAPTAAPSGAATAPSNSGTAS
jgi:type IV pilus assembly protein PilO